MTDSSSFGFDLIKHETAIKSAMRTLVETTVDVHLQQEITNIAGSLARHKVPFTEGADIYANIAKSLAGHYQQTLLEMKRGLATMGWGLTAQHYVTAARFAPYEVETECNIKP